MIECFNEKIRLFIELLKTFLNLHMFLKKGGGGGGEKKAALSYLVILQLQQNI